jgi:hypothetical protein
VEDRNEPSPAVARQVPVALEFNEDNVGLVDASLRMLPAIVGHLDRNRGVPRLTLVLQQLAGERPAGPCIDRGCGAGSHIGYRAGTWWLCRLAARLSRGLRTGGKPNTGDAQQDRSTADLRHVKSSLPPLRGGVGEGSFIVGAHGGGGGRIWEADIAPSCLGLAERVSRLSRADRLDETDLGRCVSQKLSGDGSCLNDPVSHPMILAQDSRSSRGRFGPFAPISRAWS